MLMMRPWPQEPAKAFRLEMKQAFWWERELVPKMKTDLVLPRVEVVRCQHSSAFCVFQTPGRIQSLSLGR